MPKYYILFIVIVLLIINVLLGFQYLRNYVRQKSSVESSRINILDLNGWKNFTSISKGSNNSLVVSLLDSTEILISNANDKILLKKGEGFDLLLKMKLIPQNDKASNSMKGSILLFNNSQNQRIQIGYFYENIRSFIVEYFQQGDQASSNYVQVLSSTDNKGLESGQILIEVRGYGLKEHWSFYDYSLGKFIAKDIKLPKPFLQEGQNEIYFGFYPSGIYKNGVKMIVEQLEIIPR